MEHFDTEDSVGFGGCFHYCGGFEARRGGWSELYSSAPQCEGYGSHYPEEKGIPILPHQPHSPASSHIHWVETPAERKLRKSCSISTENRVRSKPGPA